MKRALGALPGWPWKKRRAATEGGDGDPLTLAASDYAAVQSMLDKLEHGHIHLAVFGRVSTGKSSLLNALIGKEAFAVSPLHGETRLSSIEPWDEVESGGVFLIDTPGLDEAGGEEREHLAREVTERSDLVIFVVDSDITESELASLKTLAQGRPVIVALNKRDLFTAAEEERLLSALKARTDGLVDPGHIIAVSAQPRPQLVIERAGDGSERETERPRAPDVEALKLKLWDVL